MRHHTKKRSELFFEHLMNPASSKGVSRDDKMKLLEKLDKGFSLAGYRMTQADARRHGYGGVLVQNYWRLRKY